MAEVTCGVDSVSVDIENLQGRVSHPNPVSSPTSSEDGHGDEAQISFPTSEDDAEVTCGADSVSVDTEILQGCVSHPNRVSSPTSSEDGHGVGAHISFPICEDDEEEPHSSTSEDDRGDEVRVSLAISEDDEEEPHSSTSEDEGEEDHIPYSTSEDEAEESHIPFPQDDEKKAHLDWVSSIKQRSLVMPKKLKASSARLSCSIHRVSYGLRRHNQNAYDPQLISIGPFHHEKREGQLRAMEEHKWRYLHDVLCGKPKGWLESCLATIKGLEKRARSYYSEVIALDSNSFVEMMLLDSCFIIEFLRLRLHRKDVIFQLAWPEEALTCDLLLMENQIPFFIVRRLFGLIHASAHSPLVESALELIFPGKSGNMVDKINGYGIRRIRHLLHLLHACYILINNPNIKTETPEQPPKPKRIPCASKLVEAGISFGKREDSKKGEEEEDVIDCLKLVEAGIRFGKREDSKKREEDVFDFLDIKFDEGKGVIEIPSILVWGVTKLNFLNIIAFEQCYRHCPKRITSYTFFMDCLINTAKDVEILSKKGIICALGDEEVVASDFNSMAKEPSISYNDFYLSDVCERINKYSKRRWPKLRASLVHDYFKNPWALISVFAALLLLLLAMIQTFFTSFPKFAL
eukprot:TRINITY_DN4951_c0_g3_i1.p1 TRINITY_DN4951_c0_g3~~TRINITY_DN4951_c0_g3_i1.p1  ORF type:complete len:632 (-),score=120.25 TRINITY_DN4951_c0_g3_i1:229-2124(-)